LPGRKGNGAAPNNLMHIIVPYAGVPIESTMPNIIRFTGINSLGYAYDLVDQVIEYYLQVVHYRRGTGEVSW
jgi:hypothetical protein